MKLLASIYLILFVTSCNNTEDNLYLIDPRKFGEDKIYLSEIAEDIKYIPLDNTISFTNFKYLLTSDAIYVSAKDIGILKFNLEGSLIKKIGARGKGPGEFWYGMAFAVDDVNENVYVLDPGKIIVYSPSGTFVRDIIIKEYGGGFGFIDLIVFNSLLFLPDYLPTGDSEYCWVLLDTLGHPVSKKKNSIPRFQSGIETEGCIYKFGDKVFYYNYFNDTIFSISSNLSYSGQYLFAQGDHRWPRERIVVTPQSLNTQFNRLFRPVRMFETNKYIFLEYSYLEKWAIAIIDKKSKKSFLSFRYEKTSNGFVVPRACLLNDLDGGISMGSINYHNDDNNEFITALLDPFQLKSYVATDSFKKSNPKNPEKKKELEKLAHNLKETDNPILVLVSLKK
ncbi:MAG: 6-bladed beta-propeller [Bacteroidales bacterium]|jgi:hypothetical protein|nr:6-bladed beta-propeller [Bacteroidales bacterium]